MFAAVTASLMIAGTVAPVTGRDRPPVPPIIYDPQEGPFIVAIRNAGELRADQQGVIGNAVRAWSGPNLDAFSICFRSGRQPIDWKEAGSAMESVSRELKAQGAKVVVAPSGLLCAPSVMRPGWSGSYVVILGQVRL